MGVLHALLDERTKKVLDRYWEGEDLQTVIEDEKAEFEARTLLELLKKDKRGE